MRRLLCGVLVLLLLLGILSGCSAEEGIGEFSTNQSAENNVDSPAEVDVVETKPEEITLEEVVVYEEGGVKVTATGIEEGWTGTEVKFLVENTTEKNIVLSGDYAVVNGVTIPVSLYIDVAAGKKTIDTMTIYSTHLDTAGIEKIATINVKDARIVDTDTYMKLTDAPFEIVTSVGADYVQEIDESGDVVFEGNGVRITRKVVTSGIFGEEVLLLVKNDSGKDVTVEAENISVNGFTIDGWMYDIVYADSVRFCALDLYSTSLEENEITEVEEVCFTINLIDPHSYGRIAQSDEIKIVIKE